MKRTIHTNVTFLFKRLRNNYKIMNKNKIDIDEIFEKAFDEESLEDIVAEYVQNEKLEQTIEEKYLLSNDCKTEGTKDSLVKRIIRTSIDTPCCSRNCWGTWKKDDLIKHAQDMEKLSKFEKKVVLLTILRNNAISSESTRYSDPRRRLRFTFRYEPFGKMCAPAFRLLFDIRIYAFKGLLAHLKVSNMSIVPPMHGNKGKTIINRENSLSKKGVIEKVVDFMLTLAETHGEFSPGRNTKTGSTKEDINPDTLWLPASFTRSVILRMYNNQYSDYQISRTAFCSLLDNEPELKHIKIRSPRTDMCDFCELQKRKIAGTKPHDESKAERLTNELVAHQKAYQRERLIYNSEQEHAEKDRKELSEGKLEVYECTEHICMDYGQSIEVPHTTDQLGGTFYLHMRNFHLFGICSALENTHTFYTYDEREAGKGSNEVISFLHDFLATRTIQTPNIRIHADNCTGQNKNKYVMWYLVWLAATGRVRRIEYKFMIKGHTHFIVDSGIGYAKKKLRRSNVFCLKHWADVINSSSTSNNAKIVNASYVYNWKEALIPYFTAFEGISKFHHFAMDSSKPGWIFFRYGSHDDDWKKQKMLKSDSSLKTEKFKNLTKYLTHAGFKGGKPEKEKILYENLRQYVKDAWKDELCPDPRTYKLPVRNKRPCPDLI